MKFTIFDYYYNHNYYNIHITMTILIKLLDINTLNICSKFQVNQISISLGNRGVYVLVWSKSINAIFSAFICVSALTNNAITLRIFKIS